MVYNTQNYWVVGLCPPSGILEARKQRFGNWICFRSQVGGGGQGPNRVGFFPPYLWTERD
jgi:hypothetical protein